LSGKRTNTLPWIVVVGGFLGAGKTTLLLAAARELESRGMRSALILNDQGDELVDTSYAALNGITSREVTGGCFCCRFSQLVDVIEQMRSHAPDVIFAEPVGSCTDISATMLLPLREFSYLYRLAPFTVLVDPARASEMLRIDADANLSFLFRKQIEEADLVCFTKSDTAPDHPPIDARVVRQVSAKSGMGVAAWLDEVLGGTLSCACTVLSIDYEEYARAEAALAWLNLSMTIEPHQSISSTAILGPLLSHLDRDFTRAGIAIVHLKAIMQSSQGFVKAAICGNNQDPVVEGDLAASPANRHDLLLNLRAVGSAHQVRAIVESNIEAIHGSHAEMKISCFHPAAPRPEKRLRPT
jgi:hypothetical protein